MARTRPADLGGLRLRLAAPVGQAIIAAMVAELVRFLRARLDADEHDVVAVQALAPAGVDVLLESTVPMLDGVRSVVGLYAEAASGADLDDAFMAGRAAGLREAVERLALIYHGEPGFQAKWRPDPATEGSRA